MDADESTEEGETGGIGTTLLSVEVSGTLALANGVSRCLRQEAGV